MIRKSHIALGLTLLIGSCNPLGSDSTINGGPGAGGTLGLTPVLSSTGGSATKVTPIPVTATWGTSVVGFTITDINVTNGTPQNFSGSGSIYTFEVVPTVEGPVTITALENAAQDAAGNLSREATLDIEYDLTAPTVTIDQASTQADASVLPVNFTVVFSEPIDQATFTASDITQGGTASGITWTITDSGDGATFTLAATAISGNAGTLRPSLALNQVTDIAGNNCAASTSTDNTAYFIPSFSSVKLWLRADALALANGASVTSWTDSSSALNHATEATNPPSFLTPAINGLPAVRFDGNDLLRTTSNSGVTGNPDLTMIAVVRVNSVPLGFPIFAQMNEDTNPGASAWFGLDNSNKIFTGFQNGGVSSLTSYTAAFKVYSWVRTGGGAAQSGNTQFWNAASESTSNVLANPSVSLVDGKIRIGRSTSGSTVNGDIAELLIWSGAALSTTTRAQVEGYLNAKYVIY